MIAPQIFRCFQIESYQQRIKEAKNIKEKSFITDQLRKLLKPAYAIAATNNQAGGVYDACIAGSNNNWPSIQESQMDGREEKSEAAKKLQELNTL